MLSPQPLINSTHFSLRKEDGKGVRLQGEETFPFSGRFSTFGSTGVNFVFRWAFDSWVFDNELSWVSVWMLICPFIFFFFYYMSQRKESEGYVQGIIGIRGGKWEWVWGGA